MKRLIIEFLLVVTVIVGGSVLCKQVTKKGIVMDYCLYLFKPLRDLSRLAKSVHRLFSFYSPYVCSCYVPSNQMG